MKNRKIVRNNMVSERTAFAVMTLAFLFIWQIFVGPQTMVVRSQVPPKQDAEVSKTQGDEAGGIEIAEKYRKAVGQGEERIKTSESHTEVEVLGRINKVTRLTDRATRRFYSRTEGANGIIEMGFDGKRVWQKTPFFRGYLSDNDPAARRIIQGGAESPLLDYKKTGRKLYRLPNETIEGKEYLVVKTTVSDGSSQEIQEKFYLDPATFLIRRTVRGADITQTTTFDDYRQLEGSWVAFTQTTVNPNATVVNRIKSVKHNVQIDEAKFEYRDELSGPGAPKSEPSPSAPRSEPSRESVAMSSSSSGDAISETMRIETFEMVWNKVNDTYWDKTFNGVDWKAMRDRYLPLIKASAGNDEFHKILNRMVGELRVSHFRVAPPAGIVGLGTRQEDRKNGGLGITLRWLDGQLVIADLDNDSSAFAAGIRKGFIVTKINGKTPSEIYDESKKETLYEPREAFARARAAQAKLNGRIDAPVKLEVLNELDKPVHMELIRKAPRLGQPLEFESKKLDSNIGYIRFNLFSGDLLPRFQAALREFRETEGLIIDLRGNPGGAGDLAPALANLLSANPGSLGSLQFRYALQDYSYKGTGDQAYKGKVVLLVDEQSGSTAEVFSGGLQENKRATVIGVSTAGAVLPSRAQGLPSGGVLIHVISNFRTPKGVVLEGRGVIPDIKVQASRAGLLNGQDTALERGIEFVKGK